MTAHKAFDHLIKNITINDKILDLGCGKKAPFTYNILDWNRDQNLTSIDYHQINTYGPNHLHVKGDVYSSIPSFFKYDIIWCSHVMEHLLDINEFINLLRDELYVSRGTLYLTVPPMKPELVGGHLTLWTPLLLCYNFIVRGWDLSDATILIDKYDITLITKFHRRPDIQLNYDIGDIELLAPYFPCGVYQGINGFDIDYGRPYENS